MQQNTKNFNANVGAGSVYGVEVKKIACNKISLSQDNGQEIIIHWGDIEEMIKKLEEISEEN